ncbi:hypothetical protein BDB00DRAFT_612264 [Zychaea mexicana]|uniref:uncharacterized protein n=1 Tax=Zychaea mexicana TaxID=64656 RepID=UPI0022FE29C3|nr:uncharacterized protein BDB00DRAFT_612264 [Zychaea mexicana]KAI9489439.1 hypothetical protein BDB00DRAFT_612264 [Zychaea mexicana]
MRLFFGFGFGLTALSFGVSLGLLPSLGTRIQHKHSVLLPRMAEAIQRRYILPTLGLLNGGGASHLLLNCSSSPSVAHDGKLCLCSVSKFPCITLGVTECGVPFTLVHTARKITTKFWKQHHHLLSGSLQQVLTWFPRCRAQE